MTRRPPVMLVLMLAGCASSNPQPGAASGGASSQAAVVVRHTPPIAFVSFMDPKEKAFSVDVPKTWPVRGGLFRFASVDTRSALELTSPDGEIRVTSGDADIPTFSLPSEMLTWTGFREGSWYSPGYGVRMLVRRYQSGTQFAEDYVRNRALAPVACTGVQITQRQDRADLAQSINALYRTMGAGAANISLDVGEVRFNCTRNGANWRGYYLAGTLLVRTQGGGIWHVDHLIGYVAAQAKTPIAEAVLMRMVRTAHQNPEWLRMQQNITANTSRIVAQTGTEISNSIRQTFENRWRSESEIMRKDANARRGTTDLIDPDTGETWNVRSEGRYFWRKPGSDVILSTETADSPGAGFQAVRAY